MTDTIQTNDKRYRILVMLHRADRPKYWDFHCLNCRTKVLEISGSTVYAVDDAIDSSAGLTKGYLCPGARTGHCDIWYYFEDVK